MSAANVLEAVKGLNDRIDGNMRQFKECEERIKHYEEQLKKLGGDVVSGDAKLAEAVKAVADVRATLEKYTRQPGGLGGSRALTETDPCRESKMFPNDLLAKGFGALILAGFHPSGDARKRNREFVAEKVFGGDSERIKAMGESTDSAGGYLVPTEFIASIISHMDRYGVIKQRMLRAPMSGVQQKWPKDTTPDGFTVYYPDEGVAATVSDLAFGLITLTAKRWACATYLSNELEEDSSIALGDYLAAKFSQALAKAFDKNAMMGDGTATYAGITGIIGSANVAQVTMPSTKTLFSQVAFSDFIAVLAALPSWATEQPDFAWYLSPSMIWVALGITDSTGRPIFMPPSQTTPATILGYPVVPTNVLPALSATAVSKNFLAAGSVRAWGLWGERRGMSIARSEHVKFLESQIALKVEPRWAIQEAEGTAMAKLRTAAS